MPKKVALEHIFSESRILVVDDAKTSRLMLTQFCKSAGFRHIEEAKDGKEGLEKILSWKPDLVFIDMHMPQIDGMQVCQELQRLHLLDNMIIIMQTSGDKELLVAEAFDVGVTDFISKPLIEIEAVTRAVLHLERLFLFRQSEYTYSRMHDELKEAATLQKILLPDKKSLEDIKNGIGLDIAHYYHPATQLAGDYLSIQKLSRNRVALIFVDVSGHGVTAALYAFAIHTLLDYKMLSDKSPGEVLETINTKLHRLMAKGKFATMFLGIFDPENQFLDYAAAATPSPIFISQGKHITLNTKGHLLGVQEIVEYETHSIPLTKGDILLLYSDALIETANPDGSFMQEQEIVNLLLANNSKDCTALINTILASFYMHYSKTPSDDLSMLVCKL